MSHIQVKQHGPGGTIILNRPEKRNALTRAMIRELRQALEDFHLQRSIRAVTITGAGTAFSAGMDIAEMHATSQQDNPYPQWHEDAELFRDLLIDMLQFPKPIIAAVNGPAFAGGAGLVLAADLVIAGTEARFALPEPLRGIVAGIVAPLLLFRVGGGWGANLLLTARTIDAQEGHRIGVFHEVVASDLVWARSMELTQQCAQLAPEAVQLTKQLVNQTVGEQLETQLSAGAAISATARTTECAMEGLRAFLEKRTPQWP